MEINITKSEHSKYVAEVKLPVEEVTKMLEEALAHEAENVGIKGFRKGKAPLHIVKDNIDFAKLRSHALNHFLPDVYSRILKENKILPIIDPRFEIMQFEEGKELIINVILIERPEIILKDYKKSLLKKYKEKQEAKDSELKEEEEVQKETKNSNELTTEEIVAIVSENSEVGLAELLIEEEANRMLTNLMDQLGQMGLNIEQYLSSIKKKPEEVRAEYIEIAKKTLHADFALTEIAIKEGFTVDESEIDSTIAAVPDEKSRELLEKPEQRAYIKAVLTKSKTLTKLAEAAKIQYDANKSSSKKGDK